MYNNLPSDILQSILRSFSQDQDGLKSLSNLLIVNKKLNSEVIKYLKTLEGLSYLCLTLKKMTVSRKLSPAIKKILVRNSANFKGILKFLTNCCLAMSDPHHKLCDLFVSKTENGKLIIEINKIKIMEILDQINTFLSQKNNEELSEFLNEIKRIFKEASKLGHPQSDLFFKFPNINISEYIIAREQNRTKPNDLKTVILKNIRILLLLFSLKNIDLNRANLCGANLCGANLCGANLSEAKLSKANLCGANLSGADLSWANLSWADLSEANLCGANLSWANLSGTNLRWANLCGANLSGTNLRWAANLCRANLCGADLTWADLSEANLSGTNLIRANLSGTSLGRVDLSGANLSEAKLSKANLRRADLSGADLTWADLSGADLTWADLSGADLTWADLSGADLSGADLSWVDLSWVDLSEANLTNCKGLTIDMILKVKDIVKVKTEKFSYKNLKEKFLGNKYIKNYIRLLDLTNDTNVIKQSAAIYTTILKNYMTVFKKTEDKDIDFIPCLTMLYCPAAFPSFFKPKPTQLRNYVEKCDFLLDDVKTKILNKINNVTYTENRKKSNITIPLQDANIKAFLPPEKPI